MADPTSLLVKQVQDGNKAAFEKLFHEHYSMLCRFGMKWLDDPDQVEEIVQDVFVRFWEKREVHEITGSFRSYLFSSVRNACLNRIKHEKVKREHSAHVLAMAPVEITTADHGIRTSELKEAIDAAVNDLPERCMEVFRLSREEGKKYSEIAQELDISIKTVENQMGKALKILRSRLSEFLTTWIIWLLSLWN